MADTGRALFETDSVAQASDGWAIVLAQWSGAESRQLAQLGHAKVLRETSLDDARVQQRGEKSFAVVYGRYDRPDDRLALRDLARVKGIKVSGKKPFAGAFLAPPPHQQGSTLGDRLDLRTAAARQPGKLYSLQIGVYARPDRTQPSKSELREFQEASEAAVRRLRGEGIEAYYYHGPNSSSVTVGLWDERDYNPNSTLTESAGLTAMRARFPEMLINGMGQRKSVKTTTGEKAFVLEKSRLVALPR